MFDLSKLLSIMIQGSSFISFMAAIVAGIVMLKVTNKFGTGILASGFKTIAIGVMFIAIGILIDALESYLQISNALEFANYLLIIKAPLFVIGTYVIVIGSKKTGDKIESLTK